MAQQKTIVICNKTLYDHDGQVFTEGQEYIGNICNVMKNLKVINNFGQEHRIGNWEKHFKNITPGFVPNINPFKYCFTIQHDQGKHRLTCYADSLSKALKLIMNAEQCPERAVLKIKISENK